MGTIKLDAQACRDVDAYWDYKKVVGDDDKNCPGGVFTEEQFAAYKKKWIPIRLKNRIYVGWSNPDSGVDCKLIGPDTPCFCGHRYINHKTDFEKIPNPIRQPCENCPCDTFHFIPSISRSQPIRCKCKHLPDEHKLTHPYGCKRCDKAKCNGFTGTYMCECGLPAYQHIMIRETKAERQARGKPVGQDVPFKAMGGLTGFSSLAAGHARYDPSGAPGPSVDAGGPIGPGDHPFLKMHAKALPDRNTNTTQQLERREGEDDMEYFERLYKWKVKNGKFK